MDQPRPIRGQGPADALGSGPAVPDYELLRKIGCGAYGEVWLARSKATGALRAAKIVWRHTFEDERPFQREFEGIQKFERISRGHPSQLALFHIGRNAAEGCFYYVMELADGVEVQSPKSKVQCLAALPDPETGSLEAYTPRTLRADLEKGRLPAEMVLEIGLTLAETLGHLHSHGLVHRDVKPSNIIFVNGRPKLADIGLVTDASDRCSLAGTEGYLQADSLGKPQGDIFALGKVLYESITGMDRRKFPDLPQDLRSWPDANLATELNEIILRACAGDIKMRYQSAAEIQADLARLAGGTSILQARRSARRLHLVHRGAAWVTLAAAVLGLLAMANHALHPATAQYVEKPSTNGLANQLYAQGKTHFDQFTSKDLAQAVACFQQATQADPRFAAAYGYLAAAYSWWSPDGWNVGWKDLPKARTFAEAALALDDSQAEPHLALGMYHMMREWDWSDAEVEYKKAMRLNPSAFCRLMYAEYLRARGRMKEAMAEISEAKARDPNSRITNMRFASFLRDAREFTNALVELDRIEAMRVSNRMAGVKANVLCALGKYTEAVALERQMLAARNDSDPHLIDYDRLKSAVESGNTNAYWIAKRDFDRNIYEQACSSAQLGDPRRALQELDRAAAQTNVFLTFWVMTDWRLDPVRSEPGFTNLLKKMHLQ